MLLHHLHVSEPFSSRSWRPSSDLSGKKLWNSSPQNFLFVKWVQFWWCPDWICFQLSFLSISSSNLGGLFGNQEPLYSWTLGCIAVRAVTRISMVQDSGAACQGDAWRWLSLHFHSKVWRFAADFFQVLNFEISKSFTCHVLSLVLFRSPNQFIALGVRFLIVAITRRWGRFCKVC